MSKQVFTFDTDTGAFPPVFNDALGKTFAPAQLWQNINQQSTGKARAAFAGVRAGLTPAKVLCVGDSTTAGYNTSAAQSFPGFLPNAMGPIVPVSPGLSIPPRQINDPRWNMGGWPIINSFGWADSLALMSNGSGTGLATYTAGVMADTFDVYYFGTGGYGTLHLELDSGEKIDVDTSTAGTVKKATLVASAATKTHVLNMFNSSTLPVSVLGIEASLSTAPSIRIANAGVAGSASSQWGNAQGGVTGSGSAAAIRGYAPDLTIIMLGINDAKAAVPVATLQANLTATITAAKASGSVILASVVPTNTTPEATLEQTYRTSIAAFATAQNAGYVDIFGRFGSYSDSQALGMYSDGTHPSAIGYADMANVFAGAIRSI